MSKEPPDGWDKHNFPEKIAEMGQELTIKKGDAEATVYRLQAKPHPMPIGDIEEKYTTAVDLYNGILTYLEIMLSLNQTPHKPDKKPAEDALEQFLSKAKEIESSPFLAGFAIVPRRHLRRNRYHPQTHRVV